LLKSQRRLNRRKKPRRSLALLKMLKRLRQIPNQLTQVLTILKGLTTNQFKSKSTRLPRRKS
jgi:tryptophan 2,3-dioxygenase